MVLDGPINEAAFVAYIEQYLASTLKRDGIVVIDNLPADKNSWCEGGGRGCGSNRAVSAAVLVRLHSDRDAVQQIQSISAKDVGATCSWSMPLDRLVRANRQSHGVPQLLQTCAAMRPCDRNLLICINLSKSFSTR